MIIHMIVERPTDRLNWQYQLNQFKGKMDFSLGPTLPGVTALQTETLCSEDLVLILLNDLEDLDRIKETQKRIVKEVNVVAAISKACELNYGRLFIERAFEEGKLSFGAVYFETQNNSELLYQCLFKPRKITEHSALPMGVDEETVLIDWQETESKKTKKVKERPKAEGTIKERAIGLGFFGKTRGTVKPWLGKQPRLKLCVHGESALAYELGAVLTSVSDQSVLVMDLDRMAPTADIYCGIKPVVKEKYDFYSKATATGLNILLDCMKKSALSREVFRLCTQQPKGYPNLHILTGVYKLEDYEYYKSEDLKHLVDSASSYYDVILLKTNSFPYDGFTLNGFIMADAILWGGKGAIESIRYNRQLIQLMDNKQKISMEKQLWTLFESPDMEGMEKNFLVEMGLGTYCGSIPYCEKREKCLRIGERYLDKKRRELERVYTPVIKTIYKGGW